VITKTCSKCKQQKSLDMFYKLAKAKDGLSYWCKECWHKEKEAHRLTHKEDYNRRNREYRSRHPDRIYEIKRSSYLKRREYYLAQNKEYNKNRYKIDIKFRIAKNLRERMRLALHGAVKGGTTKDLIGLGWLELRCYIESLFGDGMSWDNYGEWHIDHIKPCSRFNLSCPNQQKQCFNYSNLQPLWAVENARKGIKA
jgi:hypothetical protein